MPTPRPSRRSNGDPRGVGVIRRYLEAPPYSFVDSVGSLGTAALVLTLLALITGRSLIAAVTTVVGVGLFAALPLVDRWERRSGHREQQLRRLERNKRWFARQNVLAKALVVAALVALVFLRVVW